MVKREILKRRFWTIHETEVYQGKREFTRFTVILFMKTLFFTKIEIESVFGHIKDNRSFRRFFTARPGNVNIEFRLIAIAHKYHEAGRKELPFTGEITIT